MKEISLTNSPLKVLVDDEDFLRVSQSRWFISDLGYVYGTRGKLRGKLIHRIIMNARRGQELDHRNQNKLDCRKENLRFCSRAQNCYNRPCRRDNKLGIAGITLRSNGVYQAQFVVNGRQIWKSSKDFSKVFQWRQEMIRKHWGVFAPLDAAEAGSVPNDATLTGTD